VEPTVPLAAQPSSTEGIVTRTPGWIVLALATVALVTPAYGQRTVNPVTTTAISGFNASDLTWLAVGEGDFGISGLSWDEDGDKPCRMWVQPRALSNAAAGGGGQMDICGPVAVPFVVGSLTMTVSFDGNARYFIRGIAACTNGQSNHRLKGVRIYAAKVWTTEEPVDALAASDEEDRPNCSQWHSAVYCPTGQIASAIVAHHSDREITGLALRCRRVEY
jgi:hypothetical protein